MPELSVLLIIRFCIQVLSSWDAKNKNLGVYETFILLLLSSVSSLDALVNVYLWLLPAHPEMCGSRMPVTFSTPLWRNGPPEKPILCNACGSRWRTKGTLANYTPLHARDQVDLKEHRNTKFKPNEQKMLKRDQAFSVAEGEQDHEMAISDENFQKVLEEDTSNRSSSGSAISYSESCSHFGGMDASDLAGSAQCNFWDSLVPSRKRTCVNRPKPSPVEKLTRDLYSILHQESSSCPLEDDLLYENETPMGSVEISNGGVLIRQLNTTVLEEESEASSLPIDNKPSTAHESYSGFSLVNVNTVSKEPSCKNLGDEKVQRTVIAQENLRRDKVSQEKLQILRSRDSPLNYVDLQEIFNFDVFARNLTREEQQQLMKYLPPMDTSMPPESLKNMFNSPQFAESISYYKQMLKEGIFDLSCSRMITDDCKILKKLLIVNVTKSKWVEHYLKHKDKKNSQDAGRPGFRTGSNFHGPLGMASLKRPRDRQNDNPPEKKAMTKSPKRSTNLRIMDQRSFKSFPTNSSTMDVTNESLETGVSFFSPRSLFASPMDRTSILGSFQFNDESSDQDLLLDVRSNASFPEAELLSETWKQNAGLNSLSAESGIESNSCNPASSSSSQQAKHWNG